ncbi:LolA-like putative outer membrane lipoprotein chaperone, partial [uncultured Duncaniella sp.]
MTRTFLNRILLLIALLAGSTTVIQGAETATSILDRASAKIRSDKSIAATYTISADGHLHSGTLTIAGDRFILTSPQISSWYDGKTQWTYSTQTGEVNITEPTPEELQQVNPFAIINSFRKLYKASLLKSPATEKKIKLT